MKFIGGMYAVCLPGIGYAVLYPGSHIESHWGRIELPGFDVIEFDITARNGGKLAGKAQREPNDPQRGTWQWHAATRDWEHVGVNAHGTYPCIYANDGTLVLADPEHNGSQGWRYVAESGELITGDDSLNPQRRIGRQLGLRDLWEYSHFAGVTIGQGDPPMGCHVLIDGARRLLIDGDTFFIRVKYADGIWAIGLTRLRQRDAHTFLLTRAQLSQLPAVTPIDVTPTPPPVTPQPQPEPPNVSIPDQSAVVARVREKYPTPLGDQHAACLLELARTIGQGAGLLRKDSGTNILLPDGVRVAQDIIVFPNGDGYDCLGSGETLATPQWGGPVEGSPFPSSRYYAVSAAAPEPSPIPGPIPPTSGTQLDRIEAKLDRLSFHLGLR
jgi:hypothetical protein